MNQPYLRVLGSADWHQTKNNDHSCYTLNDRILIDACSSIVVNLLNRDVDPMNLSTICFTHMHADHYMGLAPFLLYWRVRKGSLDGLTIAGPKATLRDAFDLAMDYAFHEFGRIREKLNGMPTLLELEGPDSFDLPDFHVQVINSDHAVPGLCYRFTHKATGHTIGLTGDTRYQPSYGDFFRGVDVLVHEASFGAGPLPERNAVCRHSSAREAAQVSLEAGVRRLLLTHTYEPQREAALTEARSRLDIPVEWAIPGNIFEF